MLLTRSFAVCGSRVEFRGSGVKPIEQLVQGLETFAHFEAECADLAIKEFLEIGHELFAMKSP